MRLGTFRKIISSDYDAEYKPLIDTLGNSLNNSIMDLYSALNNNLTFSDNFLCTMTSFDVTVDSTGKPNNTTQFKLGGKQTSANGIIVINAYGKNNTNLAPSGAVFVQFINNQGIIQVQNVKGLQADTPYTIKVVVV